LVVFFVMTKMAKVPGSKGSKGKSGRKGKLINFGKSSAKSSVGLKGVSEGKTKQPEFLGLSQRRSTSLAQTQTIPSQPKNITPLTPEAIELIKKKAKREEEKRKILEAFGGGKSKEQGRKQMGKQEGKVIKGSTSEKSNAGKGSERIIIYKEPGVNEQGILEIELPEDRRTSKEEIGDVWERLEKLGSRVKDKNIDEEIKKLAGHKKNVYKELEKLGKSKGKVSRRKKKEK